MSLQVYTTGGPYGPAVFAAGGAFVVMGLASGAWDTTTAGLAAGAGAGIVAVQMLQQSRG